MTKITLARIQIDCEEHAKLQARKDVAWSDAISNLPRIQRERVAVALEQYAANGAARAIRFAKSKGWIANGGQGSANAHLISAAPELLEALESLVIQLGNQPAGSTVADYCDNARHAIAKARGCV